MRYSFVGFLLLLLTSTVRTDNGAFTFTAGTAARASEVNANFQALATAIDNWGRESATGRHAHAADVAGNLCLCLFGMETFTAANINVASPQGIIHHQNGNGTFTLNASGAFSLPLPIAARN